MQGLSGFYGLDFRIEYRTVVATHLFWRTTAGRLVARLVRFRTIEHAVFSRSFFDLAVRMILKLDIMPHGNYKFISYIVKNWCKITSSISLSLICNSAHIFEFFRSWQDFYENSYFKVSWITEFEFEIKITKPKISKAFINWRISTKLGTREIFGCQHESMVKIS